MRENSSNKGEVFVLVVTGVIDTLSPLETEGALMLPNFFASFLFALQ
jgi:hypothetical protein